MDKTQGNPSRRWRRQPIYASTRLRCAVAMMILAFAVLLSALPSFANDRGCAASVQTTAWFTSDECAAPTSPQTP